VRDDRPSDTAAYVAMGRALDHARRVPPGFDDPFAIDLLPDDCRAAIARSLEGSLPRSGREFALRAVGRATAALMGTRTLEIDDGLRALPAGFQLVILGAGLDARAYRMPELAGSVAFEVDHPASQAFKRAKVRGLAPRTRALHHVSVDFARERVGGALARAGHDRAVPTAWVFEGVISYLTPREVEAAIDELAARSAPGSRLLATYNEPRWIRRLASFSRFTHEPQRATYVPRDMHRLLAGRGFELRSDRDGLARAERWKHPVTLHDRAWIRFHHVVIADRRGP
jgi:methyltransferase (TIGR00027 family)